MTAITLLPQSVVENNCSSDHRSQSGRATMPVRHCATMIYQLQVGEAAYAVPWALQVDWNGYMWLNPQYTLHAQRGGTAQLLISRHEDGYHANVLSMQYGNGEPYEWTKSHTPAGFIPVMQIH